MARYGITQTRIAGLLGVTQQTVSAKKGGSTPFTLDELDRIAPMFGMTADELVRGTRNPRQGGPDGGLSADEQRARRDSNPQPSDPKTDEVAAARERRERRRVSAPVELPGVVAL